MLGVEHVEERVVERAEIGVDLGHQVPREKAHPFPGLHQRPGQHDPIHQVSLHGPDSHRHRQPALAGARGADGECNDAVGDRLHVTLLARRARPYRLVASGTEDLGGQHLGRALVSSDHVDGPLQGQGIDRQPLLEYQDHLVEYPAHRLGIVAVDGDLIATHVDGGTWERPLDLPKQFVALPDQPRHEVIAGNAEGDGALLHVDPHRVPVGASASSTSNLRGCKPNPTTPSQARRAELPTWPAEQGAGEQMLPDSSEKPARGDLPRRCWLKRPGDPCGD